MNSNSYKDVTAGGGLVKNPEGKVLMIFRNGIWDLPKGHQEEGEDIRATALREVEEETGLEGLEMRDLICVTEHTYVRDGINHLKHTWWFEMFCPFPGRTVPQTEEGISEARWISKAELPDRLNGTYPNIVEVFRKAKIIDR